MVPEVFEAPDDDLTNLNWLQAGNILDMIPCDLSANGDDKQRASTLNGRKCCKMQKGSSEAIIVPPVAYDPQVHVQTRPPFSFSSLIFMAIDSSPDKVLPVRSIYSWITHHFPFYRLHNVAWKNTVRHKLSRSKCFKRLDRQSRKSFAGAVDATTDRRTSSWFVDPLARPSLMAAVKLSSVHVYPYMSSVNRLTQGRVNDRLHRKSNVNHLAALPFARQSTQQHERVNELCNRIHESHDSYDADDEDDNSSREAAAVESMLTLTHRINARKLIINSLQGENSQSNSRELSSDSANEHNCFIDETLIKYENVNRSAEGEIVHLLHFDEDCVQGAKVLINLSKRHPPFDCDDQMNQTFIIKCLKEV